MHKTRSLIFIFAFLLINISILGQVKIKELPSYDITRIDSVFFDVNSTRNIIPLNSNWTVYTPGAEERSVKVSVPSTFSGVNRLVYEKDVFFSVQQIKYKNYSLEFLGVNYRADILLNGMVIHKHPGGTQPFSVDLPSDLLQPNTENKITVDVQFELDDIGTVPTLQRFLFPSIKGGIFRDVFIRETEKIYIGDFDVDYSLSDNYDNASFNITARVINNYGIEQEDTLGYTYQLNCVISNGGQREEISIDLPDLREQEITETELSFELPSPLLFSFSNAQPYRIELSVLLNSTLVDITTTEINLYDISVENNSVYLNGSEFNLKGTTYFYSEEESGGLVSYEKLLLDLELIKETGFNTIRFAKKLPHPYMLFAMQRLGMFALLEIPVNSVPDEIADQIDFLNRVETQLSLLSDGYSGYSNIIAYGLGGGYIGSSLEQNSFLSNLADRFSSKTNKLVYTSFVQLPDQKLNGIDLYGIELFSSTEKQLESLSNKLSQKNFPVFISEATYPSFIGNSNGYLTDNSFEAAAKFYSDIIEFNSQNNLSGFILNSLYDYSGDFKSFYTGYNANDIYNIGLLAGLNKVDRISYKVVKSKLTDANKITIPIGTEKDDSPILFVLIGLGLSVFMALLINSKRKFREDAGRALIRPYNFYADIRDHRILSGFQTNLLLLILAGSSALLLINLLYYLRTSILLEKLLLAFGIPELIDYILYIAWHPMNGFAILFFISLISVGLLCLLFKLFSLFLKNKVFFSSIYYSVIWAFLPLALLLPLELVLYRVLTANVINLYLYIFIGLYIIWLLQRMFKGIHVIFDVRPFSVYLYGAMFFLLIAGGILVYFQLSHSTVYHIIRAFSEYKFL